MPLFIDRLPFSSWTDQTRTPPLTYWSVSLPVLLTDPVLLRQAVVFREAVPDRLRRGGAGPGRISALRLRGLLEAATMQYLSGSTSEILHRSSFEQPPQAEGAD